MSEAGTGHGQRRQLPPGARIEKLGRTLHVAMFRLTRGRLGGQIGQRRVLLLTTRGRRSGHPHTLPILFLELQDGDLLVAASNAADPERNPAWLLNLRARPSVEVEVPSAPRRPAHAKEVSEAEYADFWARYTTAYPNFIKYQQRTTRRIPLVRLQGA